MKRFISLRTLRFCFLGVLLVGVFVPATIAQSPKRSNVLFIAVDDLRPELNCYGAEKMITPNIDRLCGQGVRFDHAYCNNAVCGASRASILKGLRPTVDRFRGYNCWAKKDAPNVPSLPMTFKQQGYHTISLGKVYHHQDDPEAWSEPNWRPPGLWWALPENNQPFERADGSKSRGPAYEAADKPEDIYPDHITCTKAIETMRRLSKQDKPFFMACGFYKPHLPFVAPKKYWDLYPADQVELPDNMFFPHDLSKAFSYGWGELRHYRSVPRRGPVSDEMAHNLIRGYCACVSFTDAQIGRLLDGLKRLGLADNTIVVLWGDHGWQLGEHGFWCKHTNFEVATHVPLLLAAPGVEGGRASQRLVEYVDVYPTLCELADLPLPDHLDGKSMVPLLADVRAKHKEAIFTRHRGGESVRTDRYRYMEMRSKNGHGDVIGVGLFDLEKDPDENQNVAEKTEYAEIRKRLKGMLDEVRAKSNP